jgi:hypothetical protein
MRIYKVEPEKKAFVVEALQKEFASNPDATKISPSTLHDLDREKGLSGYLFKERAKGHPLYAYSRKGLWSVVPVIAMTALTVGSLPLQKVPYYSSFLGTRVGPVAHWILDKHFDKPFENFFFDYGVYPFIHQAEEHGPFLGSKILDKRYTFLFEMNRSKELKAQTPISSEDREFRANPKYSALISELLQSQLEFRKLPGDTKFTVFAPNRLMKYFLPHESAWATDTRTNLDLFSFLSFVNFENNSFQIADWFYNQGSFPKNAELKSTLLERNIYDVLYRIGNFDPRFESKSRDEMPDYSYMIRLMQNSRVPEELRMSIAELLYRTTRDREARAYLMDFVERYSKDPKSMQWHVIKSTFFKFVLKIQK